MFIKKVNELFLKYSKKYNLNVLYSVNELDKFDFINYFNNEDLNKYIRELNSYIKELKQIDESMILSNIEKIYLNEIITLLDNKKKLVKQEILYSYNIYLDNDIFIKYINFIKNNNVIISNNENIKSEHIYLNIQKFENIINKFDIFYQNLISYLDKCKDNKTVYITDATLNKTISIFYDFIKNNHHKLDKKNFKNKNTFSSYKIFEYKIDFFMNNYLISLKNYREHINNNNYNNNNFYFYNSNLMYKYFFNLYNNNLLFRDTENIKYIKTSLKNIIVLYKLSTYYSKCDDDIINNISLKNYINDFEYFQNKETILLDKINNLNKNNIKTDLIYILNNLILYVADDHSHMKKYELNKNNYFNNIDELFNYNKNLKNIIPKNIKKNVEYKLPIIKNSKWDIKLVEENKQDIRPAAYVSNLFYNFNTDKLINKGHYYINPKLIKTFRKFDVKTLFLHEAIPGHILEKTYNNKYNNIPLELINNKYNSIYTEGWATFVEDLLFDLKPTRNDIIGNINYDLFRNIRLIIDFGLNYYQLFNYDYCYKLLSKLTCIDKSEIDYELYRYSVRPVQATSYILGKNEIYKLLKKYKYNNNILYSILKYGPISFTNIDKLLE